MKNLLIILIIIHLGFRAWTQTKAPIKIKGQCEDCELILEGMPKSISSSSTIAGSNEPGEKLFIQGTIYKKDGRTPASGIILYIYHTDNNGQYSPGAGQEMAVKHGHLRGWIKTDVKGHYQFTTIRPASYPNGEAPQHIHPIIQEPDGSVYWIDEFLFEDDPLLTPSERGRQEQRGGSGIVRLEKNPNGVWLGRRDIILGKNIPGY